MEHLKEYVMQMVQFDNKTYGYEQRQELVRCKDCDHYTPYGSSGSCGTWGEWCDPDEWCSRAIKRGEKV